MQRPLHLLLCVVLTACGGGAGKYHAPDATALLAAKSRQDAHVAAAGQAVRRVQGHVAGAKASNATARAAAAQAAALVKKEGDEIEGLRGAVDAPVFRNAPPELTDAIAKIRGEISTHAATHDSTAAALAATTDAIRATDEHATKAVEAAATASTEVEGARTEGKAIEEKFGPEYFASVKVLAAAANTEAAEKVIYKGKYGHLSNVIGWICAVACAIAASRFIAKGIPWTRALPVIGLVGGYALARLLIAIGFI